MDLMHLLVYELCHPRTYLDSLPYSSYSNPIIIHSLSIITTFNT